jgi:hypothetical protein
MILIPNAEIKKSSLELFLESNHVIKFVLHTEIKKSSLEIFLKSKITLQYYLSNLYYGKILTNDEKIYRTPGPTKLRLSKRLFKRLRKRLGKRNFVCPGVP